LFNHKYCKYTISGDLDVFILFGSAEVGLPIDAKFFLIKIEKTCYSREPQVGNES
jgi:hypothetical protein